jgi:hypothetical protein
MTKEIILTFFTKIMALNRENFSFFPFSGIP